MSFCIVPFYIAGGMFLRNKRTALYPKAYFRINILHSKKDISASRRTFSCQYITFKEERPLGMQKHGNRKGPRACRKPGRRNVPSTCPAYKKNVPSSKKPGKRNVPSTCSTCYRHELIPAINISGINLVLYIIQTAIITICNNAVTHGLEFFQIIYHITAKEGGTVF